MPDFKMEWLPESDPGIRVLRLSVPFTLNGVFDFQTAVRQRTQAATIVDLTDVPYMDSASLGSLLGLHVSCERDKRAYALVGVSDRLRTLFRVAGVTGMLAIADSMEQALALGGKATSA
jgi:anti-anti-sigma factor